LAKEKLTVTYFHRTKQDYNLDLEKKKSNKSAKTNATSIPGVGSYNGLSISHGVCCTLSSIAYGVLALALQSGAT